jgi:hypothetical protein
MLAARDGGARLYVFYDKRVVTVCQAKKESTKKERTFSAKRRKEGGTGACVRCEEAGTRPSARVGLAMSVFTHGVNSEGKPRMINHNQVFAVAQPNKTLRPRLWHGSWVIWLALVGHTEAPV